jgi:hypothetical protein
MLSGNLYISIFIVPNLYLTKFIQSDNQGFDFDCHNPILCYSSKIYLFIYLFILSIYLFQNKNQKIK